MPDDQYRILRRIASGGMAEVFLALASGRSGVEKLVVLKQILPAHAADTEFVTMFQDEARIAALLQHPNLVQMYELGTRQGVPFISMEFLHGEDVRGIYRRLRETSRSMPLEVALGIAVGVTSGLHYAHDRRGLDGRPLNIVHRDISPQNVVLTYEGSVKVVDFGIAHSANRKHETKQAVLRGKVPYMAPEQVLGETLDRRADIWAVGALLYEMTTGQRPFRADNELTLMNRIVDTPPTPPRSLIPGYAPTLEAIVMKALARNRADRFTTAQEMRSALEELARSKGFMLSSITLSRFLSESFPERASASIEVQAEPEPMPIEVSVEASDPELLAISEPEASVPTGLPKLEQGTVRRVGAVLVISLHGILNERFDGDALGKALSGLVVLDLAKVERITSYGVREWLKAMGASEGKVSFLAFARCSEPFVSQLGMIKRFAGPGKVVSFLAPYACKRCVKSFAAVVDVARHAAVLARFEMPLLSCPSCGEPAQFDDDARSYLAFGPSPVEVPAPVAAALSEIAGAADADAQPSALEKTVDGHATTLRVHARVDETLRWRRVLDGVEGTLLLELFEAGASVPAGLQSLMTALQTLGPECTEVRVMGASPEVFAAINGVPRVTMVTVRVEGRCGPCDAVRATQLNVDEARAALREQRLISGQCPRCRGELVLPPLDWLLPGSRSTQRREKSSPSWFGVLVPALVGALVVGSALMVWLSSEPAKRVERVTPLSNHGAALQVLPPWIGQPPTRTDEGLTLSGRGSGSSQDEAVARARESALVSLATALDETLPPELKVLAEASSVKGASPVVRRHAVERVLEERLEERARFIDAAGDVWVLLSVSRQALTEAEKRWAHVELMRGATLSELPVGEGGLLVVAVAPGSSAQAAGLRPGDVVVQIGSIELTGLDSAAEALQEAGDVNVRYVARGVSRSGRWAGETRRR